GASGRRGGRELGGLASVERGHPQDGGVATGASRDGVDSRHVDLRLGKLPVQLGRRPHAVLATHKEGGLGARELPLGRPPELLERRRIGGNAVGVRATSVGGTTDSAWIMPRPLEPRLQYGTPLLPS